MKTLQTEYLLIRLKPKFNYDKFHEYNQVKLNSLDWDLDVTIKHIFWRLIDHIQ